MITKIKDSEDYRQALNENLEGLLTGKRKPLIVKEVNNTIGKLYTDVKGELMQRSLCGDRGIATWYERRLKPQ